MQEEGKLRSMNDTMYLSEIRNIMNFYGLAVTDAPRGFWAFKPDVIAEDKRTGSSIIIEIKTNTPILTNIVQALAYYKKKFPRAYFIAFSPLGTYPDVQKVADREGIWIVSSLDQLRLVVGQAFEPDRSSGLPK